MTKAIPISYLPLYSKRYSRSLLTNSMASLGEDGVEPDIAFFFSHCDLH